jgi:hypothetical protein
MIDLIDYLVGSAGDVSLVEMGGAISYPVDMSAYDNRVALRNPKNEKIESVAAPVNDSEAAKKSVLYQVRFEDVNRRGFYELELTRHTGEKEKVLFASNVDPKESRLKRLPAASMEGDFFGDKVSLVSTNQLAEQTVAGGSTEIWIQVLILLFGILAVEQFLGWFWGKKR